MEAAEPPRTPTPTDDEARLAELGYKQELNRGWSAFTNFAISFTIISVLAGCFTAFPFAWQNGGPIAASIGWPVICGFVLMVAISMAELTSKYPTAGGPYWWAHDLGGKGWSWMTGWFNIVGLIGIVASVAYGAALFLNALLGLYGLDIFGVNFGDSVHILGETWLLFALILILYTVVNIFADRFLALLNSISVGWHLLGVVVILAILVFVPDQHQSFSFVFGERINNSGLHDGSTSNFGYWFLVLPIGFLLTMYTQTGYDASAHTAEETKGAAISAAQGVWRSVFFSALIGWFVLLAFLFAASDVAAVNDGAGTVFSIFESALDSWAAKLVILIATVGQLFCGAAGLTSASRTWYAFSRDRGHAGLEHLPARQPRPSPVQRRDRSLGVLGDHRHPGAVRQERLPVRILRADRDLHGRSLSGLHHPGVSAAAEGRRFRARALDPRPPLPSGQHPRDHLRDRGRLQPSTCPTRRPACHGTTDSTRAS